MSVSFKKRESFKTKCTFPVANDKGGFDENSFFGIFKHTEHEEVQALRERPDKEVVRDRLIGWEMVDEDTKEPVPYSPEIVESVLAISSAPYHIALAFYRAASGSKSKN